MKNYCKICFAFLLSLPLFTLAQDFKPETVLPKSLTKYKFGMSLDDFKKKNKLATDAQTSTSFRTEYRQTKIDKEIKQVTYYFDAENNKPLYEMIIEFNDATGLDAHCSKKLGAPNDNEEWKWTTKEGYTFKAWRFGNSLVYALGLPSTEWGNEWSK